MIFVKLKLLSRHQIAIAFSISHFHARVHLLELCIVSTLLSIGNYVISGNEILPFIKGKDTILKVTNPWSGQIAFKSELSFYEVFIKILKLFFTLLFLSNRLNSSFRTTISS